MNSKKLTDILIRARAHVIGPSQVNPFGHAVEMDAEEFYELLHYAEALEDRLKFWRQKAKQRK
jgi:hypothetical protein